MIWALLIFLSVVFAVHWYDYTRTIEEYTFAQPSGIQDLCSTLLNDKTPLVLEVGELPWRPEVVSSASWKVQTSDGSEIPIHQWNSRQKQNENVDVNEIVNQTELTSEMKLTTGLAEISETRPFWWLPGFQNTQVGVLSGQEKLGLSWVTAERRWIGCSAGSPIVLWLAHSRYKRFLPLIENGKEKDPWSLTVTDAPYIHKVQFVEVRVRPGWCIGIPAHWGVAVRRDSEKEKESELSWWWIADQHSLLSLSRSHLKM